jgi:preprotein translocase subunit SecE
MAVAEARKNEKSEQVSAGPPNWVSGPLGWAPRKLSELKTFFVEVRSELKKVTWPSKQEVYGTTIVVILTTVFFGFYLYGLDILLSQLFTKVLGSR